MTRKKKPRRRMVCSFTFGFHDGSVIAVGPNRKPSDRKLKEDGLYLDEDGVFHENYYSPTSWQSWEIDERRRVTGILANRLNTRRAIRELVLPELNTLHESIESLREQLDRIEKKLDQQTG